MRLTFTVVWKSWASNPLRTALTVLGIACGVAIVVAIHTMDHNTVLGQRPEQPDRGVVDLEVLVTDPTADRGEVQRALAAREGVGAVGLWHQVPRLGLTATGKPKVDVRVYGLAPLGDPAFSHYLVRNGQDLEPGDADGILLGERQAHDLGVGVGDRVTLATAKTNRIIVCEDGKPTPVEISGPALEPRQVTVRGLLAYERVGRDNFGQVAVASYDLASRLHPAGATKFQILRDRGADLDRLRQGLVDAGYAVEDRRSAMVGERADERAFRNGVKILGGLALVVGMFLVFQTLSQSLVERLRQLGLLRCLGASRRAVASIFLLDAVAMGVMGASMGVGLGLLLAKVLQHYRVSSLGVGKDWTTFVIPWGPVLWTVALAMLFTLAGASFPLWRARQIPPLAILQAHGVEPRGGRGWALRGVNVFLFVLLVLFLPAAYFAMTPLVSAEGEETLIVLGQIGGLIFVFGGVLLLAPKLVAWVGQLLLWPMRRIWPLPGFLVTKNLLRNPGRLAASVCGLGIVLVALIGLESITHALHGDVRRFAVDALDQRLFLEFDATRPLSPVDAAALVEDPHVVAVEALEGRGLRPHLISGLAVEALARPGGPLADSAERQALYGRERCLVVSRRLAKMQGLSVDDAITLQNGREKFTYRVLAISDRAGFAPDEPAWAVASPTWVRRDFCLPEANIAHLVLHLANDRPNPREGLVARLRERLGDRILKVKHGRGLRDYLLRDVQQDFWLFHLLLAMILGMSVLGLLNSLTLAAVGRSREIGVMRALGLGVRPLRRVFLLEGALVGILASLLALGLGVPLGRLIVTGLNAVAGLDAPYVLPTNWFYLVPAIGLAAGLVAAILPGRRASRHDVAAAVRYE